jgi:hypothetical protein
MAIINKKVKPQKIKAKASLKIVCDIELEAGISIEEVCKNITTGLEHFLSETGCALVHGEVTLDDNHRKS